jgi:hypothetical protein
MFCCRKKLRRNLATAKGRNDDESEITFLPSDYKQYKEKGKRIPIIKVKIGIFKKVFDIIDDINFIGHTIVI